MIRGLGLAFVAVVSLWGCKNSRYCDVTTPCEDEATPFCDVDGVISGIRNHCTAYPGNLPDAMIRCDSPADCSGATPACDSTTGYCVACLDDSTCPTAEAPVCMTESHTCGGCGGDGDCADRGDGRTTCDTTTGHCERCVDDGDCTVATAPICGDDKTCRACSADTECGSGVCDLDGGGCVAETDVIYVATGGTGTTCTKAAPCGTLAAGVGQVVTTRKWILVAPSVTPYVEATVSIDDRSAVIKGAGATLRAANDNTAALVIEGTSNVLVEGLTLSAPLGTTPSPNADAVRCADATATPKLTLRGATLDGSKGQGVDGNPCDLTVVGSVVQRNAGGGVTVEDGTVTISRSVISENGDGGVFLDTCNFTIVDNFFWDNG
jgi:Right handed beta helix region